MKRILLLPLLIFYVALASAQQGQWTWMNGSDQPNQPGVYGVQDSFAPGNTPPALYEAIEWTDHNGNFWLFSGIDINMDVYSDLWEFKPALNEWAWIKGPGLVDQPGIYGVQGVPSPANNPGSRGWGLNTWVDTAGNLWLFGGMGYDSAGAYGNLNDLWKYNIATNEWTWMKGPLVTGDTGSYTTMGVELPTNNPHSRQEASASWTDDNNNLWMFGGSVGNLPILMRTLGDMWKFDIGTNNWAWMKGSTAINSAASYGTRGVAAASNEPGSRQSYSAWKDCSGDLWMFGGKSQTGTRNDLWKFNIPSNNWTWMGGPSIAVDTGVAGTPCVPDTGNLPQARFENRACWTTCCDRFINFGGIDTAGWYNDLWTYNALNGQWTLMSGSTTPNQPGNYGSITVSSPTNVPGSRSGVTAWKDTNGALWIFGGLSENENRFNDVWRFVIDSTCPAFTDSVISAFSASPLSGCGPLTVNFNNSSANGSSYTWFFGDGGSSTAGSPTHTYIDTGTFTVTLITTGGTSCASGTDTTVIPHYITVSPGAPATITTGKSNICPGDSTQICAPAGLPSYNWNTGDTTACIETADAGPYYVTVSEANGCTVVSNQVTVSVYSPLPVTISVNGDTLTSYSAVTYQWYLNGAPIAGATSQTYIASTGGTYTVEVTDTNGCAETSAPEVVSSINDLNNTGGISIYPNPNYSGSWQLAARLPDGQVGNNLLGATVEVFDVTGQIVFQSIISNQQSTISIPNAAEGVYMLRIVTGEYYVSGRLVKL